jgi:hypothetical protein
MSGWCAAKARRQGRLASCYGRGGDSAGILFGLFLFELLVSCCLGYDICKKVEIVNASDCIS